MTAQLERPVDMVAPPAPLASEITLDEVAQRLVAKLAGRQVEIDELGRLPDDVWSLLIESGFVRAFQPKRWGGREAHPWDFYRNVIDVAAANASVGWVTGVIGVHPWQTATYAPETQDEIWGRDASIMNSSSYAPSGTAEIVEGGYILTGRWQFSSGSEHCTWVNVGCLPRMLKIDGRDVPDFRSFLVPIGDYRIERTWNVGGLSGTGSNDIVIDHVFVPERRTISHWPYTTGGTLPGWAYNDGPLYRIPWGAIFGFALSSAGIGACLGFFNEWVALSKKRFTNLGLPVAEDPFVQVLAAEARYAIDAARMTMERDCNDLYAAAEARTALPLPRRAEMRFNGAYSAQQLGRIVDRLYQKSSGKIVFLDHPLHRRYQDVKTIMAHVFLEPDAPARVAGAGIFGLPLLDFTI